MNKEEIKRKISDDKIKFIQLQFININGQLQAVEKPIHQLDKIINNEIMIDGSSIKGYSDIHTSDLFLAPDWNTYLNVKFIDKKVARVICNIIGRDGKAFPGDPRNILQRCEQKYNKKGYQLSAAFEAEFFLLTRDDKGNLIPADETGYFGVAPLDTADHVKREIAEVLENHGFKVEAFHKEVAEGQHEINYQYSNAIGAADQIITLKWIVRAIAVKHNLIATFMPKPFHGINGSGMHTNISIFKDGQNVFARNSITKVNMPHQKFVSGIMRRAKEMASITNPTVNSYKRLIPGYEAPNCIAWSDSNRTTLYRIPASTGMATRVEKRNVDPTANPYLVLALIFEAGFEGINSQQKPFPMVYENLFRKTRAQLKTMNIELLPHSLGSALEITAESDFVKNVLGPHTFTKFLQEKYDEWDQYRQIVHQWEKDKYINY